jgi:hypothetical protein
VILHANPVAKNGTASEWGRWVDGQDRHFHLPGAQVLDDSTCQCALTCTWCSRDANGVALAATLIRKSTYFARNDISAL